MKSERAKEVKETFERSYIPDKNDEWIDSYVAAIKDVQVASESKFRSPEFQKRLWEIEGVASVGMGISVGVPGAYSDSEVVDALWRLKQWEAPDDILDRARAYDAEYTRIIELVSPRYNARRPLARLARIFATVRPSDCLCLLNWGRVTLFREWLELPRQNLDLIGQHVICRAALQGVLRLEQIPLR